MIQRVSFQGSVSALIPTFSRALGLVRRLGRFPINPTTTHSSHYSCGTSRAWNLGVSEIWCFFPVSTRRFHKENGDTLELGYSMFRQVHVRTCWDVILGLVYIYINIDRHPHVDLNIDWVGEMFATEAVQLRALTTDISQTSCRSHASPIPAACPLRLRFSLLRDLPAHRLHWLHCC